MQIFEGTKLRAGRFSITAEVVEGPDDVAFAELVLPEGERIPIGADPVVIGRLPECAVVLGGPQREPAPRRAPAGGRRRWW